VTYLRFAIGRRTSDEENCAIAVRERRIVVTKDRDFVVSFWLKRTPPKLLLISTDNIANEALFPSDRCESRRT
jgi:predicted nuclease of predicted toxin-antitoxin system